MGDQDAIEFMCFEAVQAVYELEHMGLPFSRTAEGRLPTAFGGHTNNVTGKPVRRACYAADRTGHMILQTLYQQCIKNDVNFFDEFQVLDVLIENGVTVGVTALELATGELHIFHAKAVIFATGGHGRIWEITSNAYTFTGDGPAVLLRRGIPLEDMEFFQFHPTGIYRLGILITEGVHGEGGVLINNKGDRFMEHYAPTVKDLASRDVVSRAMYLEMRKAGVSTANATSISTCARKSSTNTPLQMGAKPRWDPLSSLPARQLLAKLPDIVDFARTYLGVDPVSQPMPVQPTAHYAMGGIPTNMFGEVVIDDKGSVLPGLFAAGECACVSVHGANRLGTNSLLDLDCVRKARRAPRRRILQTSQSAVLPADPLEFTNHQLNEILSCDGQEKTYDDRHRNEIDHV